MKNNRKPGRLFYKVVAAILLWIQILVPIGTAFAEDTPTSQPVEISETISDTGSSDVTVQPEIATDSSVDSIKNPSEPKTQDFPDRTIQELNSNKSSGSAAKSSSMASSSIAPDGTPQSDGPQLSPNAQPNNVPKVNGNTGALKYSYPIVVPPGRNGMTPEVSLEYNSQNNALDSAFGYGWDISIPSISIQNKHGVDSLYSGTYKDFITSDKGELGQLSGNNYGLKSDDGSFSKYTLSSNIWTVTTKSGLTYTYGTTAASRQDDPADATHIYKWMLDSVTDTNGNSISYTYFKDAGQIYPDTITYTNTPGVTGPFTVTFVRESAIPLSSGYITGFNVVTNYHIANIVSKISGTSRRSYELVYGPADNNGAKALIKTITESGTDNLGATITANPTKLNYTHSNGKIYTAASPWTMPTHVLPGGTNRQDSILGASGDIDLAYRGKQNGTLIDINGDGYPDWIETMEQQYAVGSSPTGKFYDIWLGSTTGWVLSTSWTSALPFTSTGGHYKLTDNGAIRLTDINGDGLPDWVMSTSGSTINGDTHVVWLNTGSGWAKNTSWIMPTMNVSGTIYGTQIGGYSNGTDPAEGPLGYSYFTNMIDVNNDGLVDLVQTGENTVDTGVTTSKQYGVWLNTGSGWTKSTTWTMPTHPSTGGTFIGSYVDQTGINRIIDINGDNLPDWVETKYDSSTTENYGVWINTGTGWVKGTAWTLPVHTNTLPPGVDTTPAVTLYAQANTITCDYNDHVCGFRSNALIDVNGDNLPDFVETGRGNSYLDNPYAEYNTVWINNGKNGWVRDTSWTMPTYASSLGSPSAIRLGNDGLFASQLSDINNDGLVDFIASCDCETTSNAYTIQYPHVFINNGAGWVHGGWTQAYHGGKIYKNGAVLGYTDYYTEGAYPVITQHRNAVLVDINGDGSLDWVESNQYESPPSISAPSDVNERYGAWINSTKQADLLSSVTTPHGAVISISYASQVVVDKNPTPETQRVQAVASISTIDGIGGAPSVTSYSYTNGKYFYAANKTWRKFAGFQKVSTTDPDGTVTINYYHQGDSVDSGSYEYSDAESMIGKLYRTDAKNSSGNMFTLTTIKTDKTARTSVNSNVYFVYPTQTMVTTYEGNSTKVARAERYVYNTGTGNMTTKTDYGEVDPSNPVSFTDIGTDLATTTYSYATNSGGMYALSDEVTVDQAAAKVRQTRHYYDNSALGTVNLGNETKTENWKTGSTYVNTQKTYNSYGLPLTSKDERGEITNYTYDSYVLYPATVTDPLLHNSQYTYEYINGKVADYTDQNGNLYKTVYDGLGRLRYKKIPDPLTAGISAGRIDYSYSDQPTGVSWWATSTQTDAGITFDTYHYTDGLGRAIQDRRQTDPNGSWSNYQVVDYAYDTSGRIAKQALPYMSWGPLYYAGDVPTDPTRFTAYTYDPLGRVKTVTNAVGVTTYSYGDWRISVTDANGDIKRNQYDAYGNLEHVEEVNGTSTYITYYEWNLNKKLTKITDALGNVRNFTYDGLGRRLTAQDLHAPADAVFGTWTYGYDDAGNMTQSISPNAATVNYTYDDVNRVLTENYTGATGTEITYAYDSCAEGVGKLCTVTMTSGANTAYTYDYNGNIASESKVINGNTFTTSYTYNRNGDIVTLTYPNGGAVQYVYKSDGLVGTIKGNSGSGWTTLVGSIGYSPDFKVSSMTYANGVVTTNTYDWTKVYRLTNKQTQNSSSVVLQSIAYAYDSVGNITSILDSSATDAAKTLTYTYDDLSRIKTATATGVATGTSPYTESYTYDALGNILTKGSYTYSYQGHTSGTGITYANPDAVTSISGSGFTYDNNGNMLTGDGGTVTWNYKDQVTKIANTAGSVYSYYDHTGNRIRYSIGGASTYYPNKYYSSESGVQTNQVYLGNMLVATTKVTGATVTPYFVHTDHILGSNVITTTSGSKTQLLDYYPFGDIRLNQQTGTFDEQNKYGGHVYDSETDLNYLGARYYKSQIGRFISQDPSSLINPEQFLTDPQQLNFYSYARNNPITMIDPDGRSVVGTVWSNVISGPQERYNAITSSISQSSWQPLANSFNNQFQQIFPQSGDSAQVAANKNLNFVLSFTGGGGGRIAKEVKVVSTIIPDSAIVARGGSLTNQSAEKISSSIGTSRTAGVTGFSVQCSVTCTSLDNIGQLGQHLPNNQLGITTAGDIRKMGGDVIRTPGAGYHATVTGIDGNTGSSLFSKIISNPNPFKR